MRRKIGSICLIFGIMLIISMFSLVIYNQHEAEQAESFVNEILPQIIEEIPEEPTFHLPLNTPQQFLEEKEIVMKEVEIDGYKYIGYLSIPALGLDLPVMTDWSYDQLKIAPCRYCGTVRGKDLVLLAHNYLKHFGRLKELEIGDKLFFKDMDGITYKYSVVAKDVLDSKAVEEMTSGEYDLTIFTCTPGGVSRVTVFCELCSG